MADNEINVNALPVKTAPSTGDKMLMIGSAEEYQIDYDQLASAILDKLATKQYSELDTTAKTVLGALDELNGKSIFLINHNSIDSYREGAHFIYGELIKDKGYLFGLEYQYTALNSKYGAQFIISWTEGIKFRKLNLGNWSEWDTLHT